MKMRRSIENAEHVGKSEAEIHTHMSISLTNFTGLFAPRVGQNFRDEQRRRNSQYDRGTRHAAIEDLYGNNNPNTPNTFRPGSQYGQLVPYYPPVAGLHHY